MNKENRDYKSRYFYRSLYNAKSFDYMLLAWRFFGKKWGKIISRSIGLLYALTHSETVQAIRANIALLAPEKASLKTAFSLLMNQAESLFFYAELASMQPEKVLHLLDKKEGFHFIKQAYAEGNGCLLVSGHFGFFELGGLVMNHLGFPVTTLTQPEPSQRLTQWRSDFRAKWGGKTLVIGDDAFSVVEIARILRNREFVAMLIDRPYKNSNSISVECPHGHILFSSAPVLIALISGCPIIPVGITKQSDGRYQIAAQSLIYPKCLPAGREESLAHFTREIAKSLIPKFQETPDQWYHFSSLGCKASSELSLKSATTML